MNLVLDTHIFLWCLEEDEKLAPAARRLVLDPKNVILVSTASIWEIAIKCSVGKIKIDLSSLEEKIAISDFQILHITPRHAKGVARLPLLHKDPFDRLLIVQSQLESAHLLTADSQLEQYGDVVLLV